MSGDRYVPTEAIKSAVTGREAEILGALQIRWRDERRHLQCPYPGHADEHPSWRGDQRRARVFCTCIDGAHNVFDVVETVEGLDFEAAKLRVAEILNRIRQIDRCDATEGIRNPWENVDFYYHPPPGYAFAGSDLATH